MKKNTIIECFKYFWVGLVSAIVNFILLYIFTSLLKIYYIVSNILAFTVSVLVNYYCSKKFVFTKQVNNPKKELLIYIIIGIIGLGLDTILLWLITERIGLFYMLGKILTTGIVFFWNYGVRKLLYSIMR